MNTEQDPPEATPALDLEKVRARTRPYDPARYLRTKEQREAYLEAAQKSGDPRLVEIAKANIARAKS